MAISDRLTEALRRAGAGRYAVERPIGRGGAATVFLARDLRHPRVVAIKVLDPELGVGVDRFRREIEIAARLSHPHILPLLDSGSLELGDRFVPYYVMPYVTGESLRDRLTREGALPLDTALTLIGEIGSALDYAHREGVIHRDIKPENILLSDGHAVVADFGIARAVDEAAEPITIEGLAIGTPYYMSPEQVTGETSLDGRTDIYALGCVAFEMLSGRQAFAGHSFKTLMTQRLTLPVPRLASTGAAVPATVDHAVAKAMSAERDQRFPTVAAFLQAIRGDGAAGGARLNRGLMALIGAAAVVVLALGFWRGGGGGRVERISSLAVRPLSHAGADSAAMYLSDGIGEGVVDLLRRIPQLSLAAPTLVSQIVSQEPTLDLVGLGRRLAVGAVLTWEMRRRADSIHVRAELVEVKSGRLLWGQTFGRRMTETHRLEEEIARTIADSLRVGSTEGGKASFPQRAAVDPEAYDAYLRGRRVWMRATPLRARNARENADSIRVYAAQALERDPNFPGGYFLLSAYASVAAMRGWGPFLPLVDSAMTFARRAIELDPQFADPHGIVGLINLFVVDDWATSRAEIDTAVTLNPDLSIAQYFLALHLAEVEGKVDSAIMRIQRAIAIDPATFYYNTLGDLWMRAGRYDSAVGVLRQAIDIDSLVPGPYTRLIRSYEMLGRFEDAVKLRQMAPDTTWAGRFRAAWQSQGEAGYRRVLTEDVERRIEALKRAPPAATLDTVPPIREHRIAALYAQIEKWDDAMDWVEREYRRRPARLRTVVMDPAFVGLANDPRFLELKRREKLP